MDVTLVAFDLDQSPEPMKACPEDPGDQWTLELHGRRTASLKNDLNLGECYSPTSGPPAGAAGPEAR